MFKGGKYFVFRHVKLEMPSEHLLLDDPAVYSKNLKFRRKVWPRGIKSRSVSLQILLERSIAEQKKRPKV